MTPIEKAGYLAHARTPGYRKRRERAEATIRHALSLSERPYIAYSAGKDSTAMMWLIAMLRPDIDVRVAVSPDARLLHRDLDRLIEWWRAAWPGMRIEEIAYRVDPDGVPYLPSERPEWKGAYMREAMNRETAGFDMAFVGVRSDESGMRAFSNRHFRDTPEWPIYTYREGSVAGNPGTRRVMPIERWTERDVWATIALHDLPTLEAYDDDPSERTTLGFNAVGRSRGLIAKLRQRDPKGYEELMRRDPSLRRDT